jgi:hypothetical protein
MSLIVSYDAEPIDEDCARALDMLLPARSGRATVVGDRSSYARGQPLRRCPNVICALEGKQPGSGSAGPLVRPVPT